jgi:hypothetical protein
MAMFQPIDGGAPVSYILCSNCAIRTNGKLDQADMLKIEAYITGKST